VGQPPLDGGVPRWGERGRQGYDPRGLNGKGGRKGPQGGRANE